MMDEIENVKKAAIAQGLSRKLHEILWGIKILADNAGKESFKSFIQDMGEIRVQVGLAHKFYDEIQNQSYKRGE